MLANKRLNNPIATRRRGTVIVLTAVSFIVLLVCAAFAVDIGYIGLLVAEMQNTADAGSLAGASALHDAEYDSYLGRAEEVVGINQQYQGFLSLEDQVVEAGRWNISTGTFTPVADPNRANAVRVVSKRHEVPLFFGGITGVTATNPYREAIAAITPDCAGVWGLDGVRVLGNARIDSYDSTEGSYTLGSSRENGDICSNFEVRVSGSVEVYGDAVGGPVTVSGGNVLVTGSMDTLAEPIDMPFVDFAAAQMNNDNGTIGLTDDSNNPFPTGWALSLQGGDNLTLNAGTYYFDSVIFSSSSSITLTGPTTIYVAGNFDETAMGTMNSTGNPADLTLYIGGDLFKIAGSTAFYGTVVAPDAEVEILGNADFYGAIVSKTVKISGNPSIHIDESLSIVKDVKVPPMLVR